MIVRAFAIVPGAILERELNFRGRSGVDLLAAIIQASVSIGLALAGAGVWSLVGGTLSAAVAAAVALWWIIPWRPSPRQAQWGALRQLWRYSWFMSGANILVLANNTIDNVIVGRILGAGQLGFYTVTYRVATLPDDVIGYIVGRVMFPVYSRLTEGGSEFGRVYVQNLQRVALLSIPVSVGVIVAAEPIVLGLLGEKWSVVVTPLRILAVYALVRLTVAPSGEVFKGVGKPYLLAGFAALHLSLSILCLLILVPRYGLNGAALGMLFPMVVVGAAVFRVSTRILALDYTTIAKALVPSYICAAILGLALLALLPVADMLPPALGLAMLVVVGICVYVGATALFARSVIRPIWAGLRRAAEPASRTKPQARAPEPARRRRSGCRETDEGLEVADSVAGRSGRDRRELRPARLLEPRGVDEELEPALHDERAPQLGCMVFTGTVAFELREQRGLVEVRACCEAARRERLGHEVAQSAAHPVRFVCGETLLALAVDHLGREQRTDCLAERPLGVPPVHVILRAECKATLDDPVVEEWVARLERYRHRVPIEVVVVHRQGLRSEPVEVVCDQTAAR